MTLTVKTTSGMTNSENYKWNGVGAGSDAAIGAVCKRASSSYNAQVPDNINYEINSNNTILVSFILVPVVITRLKI